MPPHHTHRTFLIGPERGLTKLEVQTLKLQGVVVSFDTAVWNIVLCLVERHEEDVSG